MKTVSPLQIVTVIFLMTLVSSGWTNSLTAQELRTHQESYVANESSILFQDDEDRSVVTQRTGSTNPMIAIGTSTLYGMGTGILVGTAYSLLTKKNDFGPSVKYGFVYGTFGGFVFGVIYVFTRPGPGMSNSAVINFNREKQINFSIPRPDLRWGKSKISGFQVKILQVNL